MKELVGPLLEVVSAGGFLVDVVHSDAYRCGAGDAQSERQSQQI